MSHPRVQVRRVYDQRAGDEGTRVLVDRLWPRGLSKARAQLDEWCKQAAPSTELRTWYAHDPARFTEFGRRYRAELTGGAQAAALAHLRQLATVGTLTLVTATKEVSISEAAILAELIRA